MTFFLTDSVVRLSISTDLDDFPWPILHHLHPHDRLDLLLCLFIELLVDSIEGCYVILLQPLQSLFAELEFVDLGKTTVEHFSGLDVYVFLIAKVIAIRCLLLDISTTPTLEPFEHLLVGYHRDTQVEEMEEVSFDGATCCC